MGRITTTAQAARIRTAYLQGLQGIQPARTLGLVYGYETDAWLHGKRKRDRLEYEEYQAQFLARRREAQLEAQRDREAIRYWEKKRRRENFRIKRLAHQQPKLRRRRADLVTRSATR